MHVFRWEEPNLVGLSQEHVALVRGDVRRQSGVPIRVHSECLTGEVFGSERCDCRAQLQGAQEYVSQRECGMILYLRQEGRGIGLTNKVKAYALQDEGVDTVDANLRLHLPVDARQYDVAAAILRHLEVESVRVITNNPDKISGLETLGIKVDGRIPSTVRATVHSLPYLEAKRDRLRHLLPEFSLPIKSTKSTER